MAGARLALIGILLPSGYFLDKQSPPRERVIPILRVKLES